MRFLKRVLLVLILMSAAFAATAQETLQNDSFMSGGIAVFQAGFVSGETAAVRLVPSVSGVHGLDEVHFLLGGATTTVNLTLTIWNDTGADEPGSQIYSGDYQVTGSDSAWQVIDLTGDSVQVSGPFRVGLTFQHNGLPSVARDDDGIKSALNFINAQGIGWVKSNLLGVTGDWIMRAVVSPPATFTVGGTVAGLAGSLTLSNNVTDTQVIGANGPYTFAAGLPDGGAYSVMVDSEPAGQDVIVSGAAGTVAGANVADVNVTCIDESTVRSNDGWSGGLNASYQGGFLTGEIAAVRLDPGGPGTHRITAVHLLYGGMVAAQTVRVQIWDDSAGTTDPGALLHDSVIATSGQLAMQGFDLSAYDIQVTGPYRVGILFSHAGYPSVARDDDGSISAMRNFIYSGGTWVQSDSFGLTGDWVIRAVDEEVLAPGSFAITSVDDLPNDQGKQVRLQWNAAENDAPGGIPSITGYAVYRRVDGGFKRGPDAGAAAYPPGDWDFLKTVPAFQEAEYSTIVPTVADSTINDGMHYSVFFVRAMTSAPGTFFDSGPDSGYSVDNLAPHAPTGLKVVYDVGTGNDLTWDDPVDADFQYFKVYRGDSPGFAVDPESPIHSTVRPDWQDTGGDAGHFYRVSGVDFSGNESPLTAAMSVSGVGDVLPARHALDQNYPNPFNPATNIPFSLAHETDVQLRIYDSRGSLVRTLIDGSMPGGPHAVVWNGADDRGLRAGSGVYYYRLRLGGEKELTRRMTLIQ